MKQTYTFQLKTLALFVTFCLTSLLTTAQMDYETARDVTRFNNSPKTGGFTIITEEGEGTLENGAAEIILSLNLASLLSSERLKDQVQVSIQLQGESNGVYVSKKEVDVFHITELGNGTSNADFTYKLTFKKKN